MKQFTHDYILLELIDSKDGVTIASSCAGFAEGWEAESYTVGAYEELMDRRREEEDDDDPETKYAYAYVIIKYEEGIYSIKYSFGDHRVINVFKRKIGTLIDEYFSKEKEK